MLLYWIQAEVSIMKQLCEVVTLVLCLVAEAVRPGYSAACSEAVWKFIIRNFAFTVSWCCLKVACG